MWTRTCGIVASLMVSGWLPLQSQAPSGAARPNGLDGLWKAQRRFGPAARGPLIIQRRGASFTADMMGHQMPMRVESGELSFALPDSQGTFRGKLETDGTILGHWSPPASPTGMERTSPVRLVAESPNRWSGQVVPAEDVFTFYLRMAKRPDGSLSAFVRNPERDLGAVMGVERLVREGTAVKLMGKRTGQTQERELAVGSYDADNDVLTLGIPNRGGSYDFRREGDESDFYPRGKHPAPYAYAGAPLHRDDGWATAALEQVGIDRGGIEAVVQKLIDTPMESVHDLQVEGVLLARHGKLVLEEYFHGQHRDKLHETRSAAKSVTATIIGAAMHAGVPLQLSTSVYQLMNGGTFPADLEARKRAMTLEHLLSMSSGYFCDDSNADAPGNENSMQDQSAEPDYYRFTLTLPLAFAPGEKAVYCSINPNLALGMLARATGESPMYTFDRLLGGPLKIRHYGWYLDPVGHAYGGGGVHFQPRDFMKIGQLMLDGGMWHGRRILDKAFVARAASPLYHIGTLDYGLAWWGMDYRYHNRTVHAFAALGAGGQNVFVIPELDMVVAFYASNFADRVSFEIQNTIVPLQILPTVLEGTVTPPR